MIKVYKRLKSPILLLLLLLFSSCVSFGQIRYIEYLREYYTGFDYGGVIENNKKFLLFLHYGLFHVKDEAGRLAWENPKKTKLDWQLNVVEIDMRDLSYKILFQGRRLDEGYVIINRLEDGRFVIFNTKGNPDYLVYDTVSNAFEPLDIKSVDDKYLKKAEIYGGSAFLDDPAKENVLELPNVGVLADSNLVDVNFTRLTPKREMERVKVRIPKEELKPYPPDSVITSGMYIVDPTPEQRMELGRKKYGE